jgi:hypothetical protein
MQVLGRFYDGHLYDALEFGVAGFAGVSAFGSNGTGAGLGGKVWSASCTAIIVCCRTSSQLKSRERLATMGLSAVFVYMVFV